MSYQPRVTAAAALTAASANRFRAHALREWSIPGTTKHTRLGWQDCRTIANRKLAPGAA